MTITEKAMEPALFVVFHHSPFYKRDKRPWTWKAWEDVPTDVKEALDFLVKLYIAKRSEDENEIYFVTSAPIVWEIKMAKEKWVF